MSDMIQHGFTKLAKRLFLLTIRRAVALCAALFALTVILMLGSVNETSFVQAYESLMERMGIRYVFLIAIAFWMLSEAAGIYVENFRNGGIYTLMMLPIPRRNVFLAYCIRGMVCVLMLWTVQVLALLVSYAPVLALCKNAAAAFAKANQTTLPFDIVRTNGLFLAVIRSDLLRILLPQSVPEAISSLMALLAAGCLPALMLTEGLRRANAYRSIFAICAAVCVLWALGCRFNSMMLGIDMTAFVVSTVLMALLSAGTVASGIRTLNKDANLN